MSPTPRRWLEVGVARPAGEEEVAAVVESLIALGCRGAVERGDRLLGYVPEPADPEALGLELRSLLPDSLSADLEVAFRWQPHEEWAESWKRGLAPRRLAGRIVVAPSWTEPELRSGDLLIVIDPGMAFGTAEHGTTRGCVRLLTRAVGAGDRVVDVGSGSGILAVAAVRLGADTVVAVEADPFSFEALVENVAANGAAESVRCVERRADEGYLRGLGPVDGVVANIETGVLGPLLPAFHGMLRPGGWLILSGVPDGEWPGFRAEVEAAGFGLRSEDLDSGWRSGLFERSGVTPRA